MATRQITEQSFEETINQDGIILLDWWAPWCGPCRAFGPIYERVAAKNPDIVFGKVNTDEAPRLASDYGIQSIPTLMVLRDGLVLYAEAGMLSERALVKLVDGARKVDVGELRRKLEEPQAQAIGAAR